MRNIYNGSSRKIPTNPSNPGGWSNRRPGSNNSYKSRWNNPDYCELRIKGWNSEVSYKGPNPKKHLEEALPSQQTASSDAFWYGLFTLGFSICAKQYIPYGKAFLKFLFSKVKEQPKETDKENPKEGEESVSTTFIKDFNSRFTMPSLPPFLEKIINGVPRGYEIAMLFHLLSMLGALCFSKVRAKYLDNQMHAPNLQVIIEGIAGVGKGKFNELYKALFSRVIENSNQRIASGEPDRIIQTIGVGTSMAKFVDILAGNKGCHVYIFDSELSNLTKDMKKENGLNSEILRYAYDNDIYTRHNRSNGCQGSFPLYLNYTFTGTADVVSDFCKNGLENGTVQRVCFTNVPNAGRDIEPLKLPTSRELEEMKDQIDKWISQYCYVVTKEGDKEVDLAVEEKEIDLSYVLKPLKDWIANQYDKAQLENNPARDSFRARSANTAFRCAMIIAMLYGQPGKDSPKRQNIIDLTLYIANYIQERLLFKFGKEQNEKIRANQEAESLKKTTTSIEPEPEPKKITDIAELARLHSIKDDNGQNKYGWDTLAKMSDIPRTTLINKIKAYEKESIDKK